MDVLRRAPLDLDLFITRPLKQRVRAIGIELEGGWKQRPPAGTVGRDSSVHFKSPTMSPREIQLTEYANYGWPVEMSEAARRLEHTELINLQTLRSRSVPQLVGEVVSEPLDVLLKTSTQPWKEWIRANYPVFVNETCGMHAHFSFRTALTYQRIMDPDLTSTTIEYIKRWADKNLPRGHHIYDRLAGKSEYCQPKYFAAAQVKKAGKDYEHFAEGCRYTIWNYCYGRYRTAECRLLPMMPDAELAISAIDQLMRILNAFIVTVGRREEPLSMIINSDEPIYREESHERI